MISQFNWFSQKAMKKVSLWFLILIAVLSLVLGILIGLSSDGSSGQAIIRGIDPAATSTFGTLKGNDGQIPEYLTKNVDFNLFWDVWQLVKDKHYEKNIPETKLFYGALAGIVAALEDPYSVFLTPADTLEFKEEIKGSFEGIGAEIGIKAGRLTIISPLPDTPAFNIGLRPNDWILKIDHLDTENISLDRAVNLIRGKRGTIVTLTIFRDGFQEPREFKIVRDAINVKSVSWEIMDGNIFYIKVRQFNDDTISLLNEVIVEINRLNARGLVLDLRNNPGGYLQSAIEVAGEWLDAQLVVSEKLRSGQTIEHRAVRSGRLGRYPTVVLVNGGSASGSEIVAGALRDWEKATIVGSQTFGKGSVQDLTNLRDGSSVKLTVAKWFTPHGQSIEDGGIKPDIEVELTEEDYNLDRDPQLDKALELLRR